MKVYMDMDSELLFIHHTLLNCIEVMLFDKIYIYDISKTHKFCTSFAYIGDL